MTTITDLLNTWNDIGVFSYVLPFLIVFAVVFAILEKSRIFGQEARGVNAVISISVAAMSLLNDYVSTFFATIFPRMGVVLAILIVIIIFLGLFIEDWSGKYMWVLGAILAVVAIFWSLENWGSYFGYGYFDWYFFQNSDLWNTLLWVAILIGGVAAIVMKKGGASAGKPTK